jgi:hypothetical protein
MGIDKRMLNWISMGCGDQCLTSIATVCPDIFNSLIGSLVPRILVRETSFNLQTSVTHLKNRANDLWWSVFK